MEFSYIITINCLLLGVTQIRISNVACSLKLQVPRLQVLLDRHIKLNLCVIQEILGGYSSECLNTLYSKNLMICQAEIGSYVKGI